MRVHVTPVMPGEARLRVEERMRIAVEIVTTYGAARWWLLRLNFPDAVAAARKVAPAGSGALSDDELRSAGIRLGSAVRRTLRVLPVDSRCLVTALVLTRMLARRGIECSFILGVRAQPRFAAHAWVERSGVALLPTSPEFHRLAEI